MLVIDPACLACAACGELIGRGPYALTASNAVAHPKCSNPEGGEMTDTQIGHLRPDHEDCECIEYLDHDLHDCDCDGYPLAPCPESKIDGGAHTLAYYDGEVCSWCGGRRPSSDGT